MRRTVERAGSDETPSQQEKGHGGSLVPGGEVTRVQPVALSLNGLVS